ncbi:H-type lectin domain-containing protein [Amylibacter sp. IMCC11727]|uniref:H-type lectin domain-containing protein n=1 Tax=Amylibacter sp. IMCC11727 TaxID=3039851 RepID=UPI00244DCB50|nr:H-type lectin domain-containing protein [Amylibacter sp. IMCC11727]WGI22642.1 H-type lectin domain-containing protein [Amylibacter sp. IMCC11727]
MKKLYSSVTGVDQGSIQLFSDFEDEGEMWSGTGERERWMPVEFSEPFKGIPSVFITLELLDLHSGANHRTVTVAENISETGFDAILRTWGDTRIARARAAWIAIGEVKGDEDWDIDYGS